MAELLPCPFCGGKAHKVFSIWSEGYRYGCMTFNCMANIDKQLISFKTDDEAIKAWNTRTPKETHEKHTETHDNTPKERGGEK